MPQVQQTQARVPAQLMQQQPQSPLTVAETIISKQTGLTNSSQIKEYQRAIGINKEVDEIVKKIDDGTITNVNQIPIALLPYFNANELNNYFKSKAEYKTQQDYINDYNRVLKAYDRGLLWTMTSFGTPQQKAIARELMNQGYSPSKGGKLESLKQEQKNITVAGLKAAGEIKIQSGRIVSTLTGKPIPISTAQDIYQQKSHGTKFKYDAEKNQIYSVTSVSPTTLTTPTPTVSRIPTNQDNSVMGNIRAAWKDIGGEQVQQNIPVIARDLGIMQVKENIPYVIKDLLGGQGGIDAAKKIRTKYLERVDKITDKIKKAEGKLIDISDPNLARYNRKEQELYKRYNTELEKLNQDIASGRITSTEQATSIQNNIKTYYENQIKANQMQQKQYSQSSGAFLGGLATGFITTPTQLASLGIGLFSRPVSEVKEVAKGFKQLPSEFVKAPLVTGGRLLGSLAGQKLIFGLAGKTFREVSNEPVIKIQVKPVKPKFSKSYTLQDVIKIGETPEGLARYRARALVDINRISPITGKPLKPIKVELTSDFTINSMGETIRAESNAAAIIYNRMIRRLREDKTFLYQGNRVSTISTSSELFPIKENLYQGVAKSSIKELAKTEMKVSLKRKGNRFDFNKLDIRTRKIKLPEEYSALANIEVRSLSDRYAIGKAVSQSYLEKGKVRGYIRSGDIKVKSYLRSYNTKRPIITDFNKIITREIKPKDLIGGSDENVLIQKGKMERSTVESLAKAQAQQITATVIKKETARIMKPKKSIITKQPEMINPIRENIMKATVFTAQVNKQQEGLENKQKQGQELINVNSNALKSSQGQEQTTKNIMDLFQGFRGGQEEKNRSGQKERQETALTLRSQQQAAQVLITPTMTIPSFSFPGEPSPKPKPVETPNVFEWPSKDKKEQHKKKKAFRVELFQNKKWTPIATNLPYQEALGFGALRTTQTLSRRFRVTPTGKETEKESSFLRGVGQVLAQKFRSFSQKGGVRVGLPKGEYIQKAPTSLGTREERGAIQRARRMKAKLF